MKKFNELLLRACGYTVLIITIFFLFLTASGGTGFKMDFSAFASVFLMSSLISASSLIFLIKRLSAPIRIIIHSVVLLGALLCMLGFIGYLASKTPADFFVIIFVYAILYAAIYAGSFYTKKLIAKIRPTKTDERSNSKKEIKPEYTPRYR